MANPVEICNLALSHLGSSATVSAIAPPDGSVEAGYCARFYGMARQLSLTAFTWQFALKRVALAEVTNTSTVAFKGCPSSMSRLATTIREPPTASLRSFSHRAASTTAWVKATDLKFG